MKEAYIFPGQGAQFPGMGKNLYETNQRVKQLFDSADSVLQVKISEIMFNGSNDDLKQTDITQPAVFIHSVAAFYTLPDVQPAMVSGHSLGELSALVAANVLSFEDGLRLVSVRAKAMQRACELQPSTMAAVLGLEDGIVENICKEVSEQSGEIVVPANYNCPGQLVISGTLKGVEQACEKLKAAGAKRALVLPVGGAFHSPLMLPAKEQLAEAIDKANFNTPRCPVYQNVAASAITEPATIKRNLIEQLTSPVKWTQCVQAMVSDGAEKFVECGPGKVLQGLVQKIHKNAIVEGIT